MPVISWGGVGHHPANGPWQTERWEIAASSPSGKERFVLWMDETGSLVAFTEDGESDECLWLPPGMSLVDLLIGETLLREAWSASMRERTS